MKEMLIFILEYKEGDQPMFNFCGSTITLVITYRVKPSVITIFNGLFLGFPQNIFWSSAL